MRLRSLVRAAENKYNRLLATLILIYLFSPFLLNWSIGDLIVFFVFLGAILVVIYQIQRNKWTIWIYISLAVSALIMRLLTYSTLTPLNFTRFFEVFSTFILLAFLSLSIYLILRELTIAEQITADIIKGGICVYFLVGFCWAALYGIIYIFDIQSFNVISPSTSRADLTHFSFTTLTTVGYGDIAPVSDVARVFANLEGMVGVMYPAIFIARLVSLYSNR